MRAGQAYGIPEDPATGSAHTALAPFWGSRLGGTVWSECTPRPVRDSSARTGLVRTRVRHVITGDRVQLTGRAVTIIDGTWLHALD